VLYVEDVPRRVRVLLGDELVADSDEVRLLHPPGRTPTYLFPSAHVRRDCFEPSERRQSDPGMGERTYWRAGTCRLRTSAPTCSSPATRPAAAPTRASHYWSLRVANRYDKDLAWTYPEPFHDADAVRGLLCFPQERTRVEVTSSEREGAPGEP
jgi:uncharacterized protein (DUF427 family)